MRWLDAPDGALFFARDPVFVFAVNLGASAVPLPPHSAVLLASGPLGADDAGVGTLPRDTAVWLAG
jgi:alpha-glucosidase